MTTPRLVRIGLALVMLLVIPVAPTWGVEGTAPSPLHVELPRALRVHGTFRNLDPDFRRAPTWTRVGAYLGGWAATLGRGNAVQALPRVAADVDGLRGNRQAPTVTWIGHSTLLIQLDGVNVLTDPNWSRRPGPVSGFVGVRRYTPPGIAFEDLPPIDVVLISHDHYDHLDLPTVRRLADAFNPRFVVPLGIGAWLADHGIRNASELDWGQSITVKGLEIVCTPAQHGSGRTLFDTGRRLWASWAIIGSKRFYFSGDSGYSTHFERIGEALGPFDLVALAIGSYTPPNLARPVHMSPEEALQASLDLRATRFIGIHWGTFKLGREASDEPPRRIAREVARRELDPRSVWLPRPGETYRW
jgi:N-acyl-phosphatidylethanolamine-hydrolysing phospholipase D